MDLDAYCRNIETYLCRSNAGHLIRLVGPSFELVRGWGERGIPLKIVCQGIDRYFARQQAQPRRRPARIDFCEADVLDAFDEWRRALGVGVVDSGEVSDSQEGLEGRRRGSLRAHLDRVALTFTNLQAAGGLPGELEEFVDHALETIEHLRPIDKGLRGGERQRALRALVELDRAMLAVGRSACGREVLETLAVEAREELEPFRARMATAAYEQAQTSALDRLVRQHFDLPTVPYEA